MAPNSKKDLSIELTTVAKVLLNDYQHDLPLSPTPFSDLAAKIGVTPGTVLQTLKDLTERGLISRVGPVIKPNSIGVSTLAAMVVPRQRLDEIAALVSDYPEVNHNYEREHRFNLWFVVTARDRSRMEAVIKDIERRTRLTVLSLPMLRDFHIDLGFELTQVLEA